MIITAGKYKGQKITAPDENITRPTLSKVRMGIFNTLQSMIDFDGKNFLDMYSGSGIMGLEALSRGFEYACCIEKNPKVAGIIKNNFKNYHGIFLEVEMENPKMINTLKRVKFYKNHGAKKLEGRYFYPNQYGDLQMDLYYIPLKKNTVRGYEIKRVIEGVFKLLHSDISHLGNVLSRIVF